MINKYTGIKLTNTTYCCTNCIFIQVIFYGLKSFIIICNILLNINRIKLADFCILIYFTVRTISQVGTAILKLQFVFNTHHIYAICILYIFYIYIGNEYAS